MVVLKINFPQSKFHLYREYIEVQKVATCAIKSNSFRIRGYLYHSPLLDEYHDEAGDDFIEERDDGIH